jgi:cell division septation protein DedD
VEANILPEDLFSAPETTADSSDGITDSITDDITGGITDSTTVGTEADPAIPADLGPEAGIFAGTEPEESAVSEAASETAGLPPEADIFEPPADPPGNAVAESGLLPVYPAWPAEDTYPAESSPEPVYPGSSYDYLPDERIVDIPEAYEPPVITSRDDSIIPEPAPVWIDSEENVDAPDLSALPDSAGPDYSEPVPGLTEPEDLMPETSFPGEALAESRDEPLLMPWENYDLTLVPAEERPPQVLPDTLPPEAEIAPVPAGPSPMEPYMGLDSFIDPIGGGGPSVTREPPVSAPPSIFSVPVISRLEQGKYYLQLAAFSRAEAVEQELSRIDKSYPLAVQAGGSPEQPLYRVLVGPVNLGESGALLLRFKGNGWGDAFIRNGS